MTELGTPVSQISGIALESVPAVIIEGQYLYFALSISPFKLIKVDKATLNVVSEYTGIAGEGGVAYGCGFVYNGKAYIGIQAPAVTTNKCRIAIIDLTTMTSLGAIELSDATTVGDGLCNNGAVVSGNFGYFSVNKTGATNERLYKIDLTTDTEVGYLDMGASTGAFAIGVNSQGGYIVAAAENSTVTIKRVNLASFTVTGTTNPSFSTGALPRSVTFEALGDGCYITAATSVIKLYVSGDIFRIVSETSLTVAGLIGMGNAVISDLYQRYLLMGDSSGVGEVRKFSILNLVLEKVLDFPTGYTYPLCAINQGSYSYWGTFNTPGSLIKIENNNLVIENLVTLPSGYNYPAIALAY